VTGKTVFPFNASERSTHRDRTGELYFVNRRREGWWRLPELLELSAGATLALPDERSESASDGRRTSEMRWVTAF
jgi:hypothetical protein